MQLDRESGSKAHTRKRKHRSDKAGKGKGKHKNKDKDKDKNKRMRKHTQKHTHAGKQRRRSHSPKHGQRDADSTRDKHKLLERDRLMVASDPRALQRCGFGFVASSDGFGFDVPHRFIPAALFMTNE